MVMCYSVCEIESRIKKHKGTIRNILVIQQELYTVQFEYVKCAAPSKPPNLLSPNDSVTLTEHHCQSSWIFRFKISS